MTISMQSERENWHKRIARLSDLPLFPNRIQELAALLDVSLERNGGFRSWEYGTRAIIFVLPVSAIFAAMIVFL